MGLFGTDGVRGTSNQYPMDAVTAMRIGQSAGRYFRHGNHRHSVVIGKDTRLSGYMIEPALVAGFVSAGMDVTIVGPIPTPAIAHLTRSMRCDLGVMISASHNAYQDNGIKMFGPDGLKLSDEQEAEIEKLVLMSGEIPGMATPGKMGRAYRLENAGGRYVESVKSTFPKGMSLHGVRIVLDCANGATYKVAPTVLWELGAEVISIGVSPDGTNINKECGSTSPNRLIEMVKERRADVGIALDGDGDRLLMVDENANIIDGDQILAVMAKTWLSQGRLKGGNIVATVMSNMGLERYLNDIELGLLRTKVGDRYVGETMRETGCNLGGEQSGHMIMTDFGTTGDGLCAALQVLVAIVEEKRRASEVCRVFTPMPQKLVNVKYTGSSPLLIEEIQEFIKDQEKLIKPFGRILIRPSGTEPLIRVMVEAEKNEQVQDFSDVLVEKIKKFI